MRCVQYERFGDESVLQLRDVPEPLPAADEVQVRVAVASLNPVDFKLRAGMLRFIGKPLRPAITGKDFAGTVSAIGMGVSGFHPGQRVFGSVDPMGGRGSCAETLVVGAGLVAPIPDGVSDEAAACLPVACGTAYQALVTHARLRAGQTLLVTGASGGVGSGAVQIARSIGARVTGVCSAANLDYVRSIGADEVLDYRHADWRRPGAVYDVVFDAAGRSSFAAARPHLARAGWYINTFPPPSLMLAAPFVRLFARQHAVPFMLKTTAAQLAEIARLAAAGILQPRIARRVRLEDVAAAQRDMQDGKMHGKVCVRVAEQPREEVQPLPFDAAVEALLTEAGLPASDLRNAGPVQLLGVSQGNRLVGVVGVEAYGAVGLLRSLAVVPDCRNTGLGKALVSGAQAWARAQGIETLYLLTSTADKFFDAQGYAAVARAEAPAAIAATAQFAELCPASSIFMRKALRDST